MYESAVRELNKKNLKKIKGNEGTNDDNDVDK
jgi:hypothetical protein